MCVYALCNHVNWFLSLSMCNMQYAMWSTSGWLQCVSISMRCSALIMCAYWMSTGIIWFCDIAAAATTAIIYIIGMMRFFHEWNCFCWLLQLSSYTVAINWESKNHSYDSWTISLSNICFVQIERISSRRKVMLLLLLHCMPFHKTDILITMSAH